jgi:hypothetical protein
MKIPLSYVIRDQLIPLASGDDVAMNYDSKVDELIAQVPI